MSALPAFRDEDVVLDVRDLTVRVGETNLVSDVTFEIGRGERVGLIGESGSGKSLTGLSLMGLLPEDLVASGSVRLPGPDLNVVGADDDAMSRIRGRDVAMVFQEPMTALNPTMRVGDQVAEALLIHRTKTDRNAARRRAMELTPRAPIRTSCPAASGSASSSPSPSRTTRHCSSVTNRRPRSTSRSRHWFWISSSGVWRRVTRHCCSSPTTCPS